MKEDIIQHLQTVEDVEEQEIDWLIPYWIPKGGITLLGGDGSVGKTNLWSYLISRLSAGMPTMLDNEDAERLAPGAMALMDPKTGSGLELRNTTCLYFSKEDFAAKRLKKNFERYEANMANIHMVDVEYLAGFTFTSDKLEEMIDQLRPVTVVFDPIQAFFPGGASMTSHQQSRETLDRLVQLGQQYNTAFLLVCHTNKKATDDWRQKITGSADLSDIARSVIFTAKTKLRNEEGRIPQYISNEKNSYAKREMTVLYTIGESGAIAYAGVSGKRFAEYAGEKEQQVAAPVKERGQPQKEICRELILNLLAGGEKIRIKDLNEALASTGIGRKAMDVAKAEMEREGIIERWNEAEGAIPCWYVSLVEGEEGEEDEET